MSERVGMMPNNILDELEQISRIVGATDQDDDEEEVIAADLRGDSDRLSIIPPIDDHQEAT